MGKYADQLRNRLNKPKKPAPQSDKKGVWMGLCNRSACLAPGAMFYNHGSLKYYCASCAHELSNDSFNKRQAERDWGPGMQLCELQPTSEPLPPRVWL